VDLSRAEIYQTYKALRKGNISILQSFDSIGVAAIPSLAEMAYVGENIKEVREALGWNQADLQKKLKYKKESSVSGLETSTRLPKPELIKRVASILECSPARLMKGVVTPYDTLRGRNSSVTIRATTVPESPTESPKAPGKLIATPVEIERRTVAINAGVLQAAGIEADAIDAVVTILQSLVKQRRRLRGDPQRPKGARRRRNSPTGTTGS
jgi:transcriptional regulator with XRE-family HTH domain